MKSLIKRNEAELVKMDCWDLQVFLGRKIYEIAVQENSLLPYIEAPRK
jgi:hypothetical protein